MYKIEYQRFTEVIEKKSILILHNRMVYRCRNRSSGYWNYSNRTRSIEDEKSKFLSTYLLKIHHKYGEHEKTKSEDKKEYLDFLEGLRGDIIYLLQRRDINENHYKMLDDRIIEYMNKINNLS
jgi:hypothetical protein